MHFHLQPDQSADDHHRAYADHRQQIRTDAHEHKHVRVAVMAVKWRRIGDIALNVIRWHTASAISHENDERNSLKLDKWSCDELANGNCYTEND